MQRSSIGMLDALAFAGLWVAPRRSAVPIAMAAALARFRDTESYGMVVVDGALLAGALAALALSVTHP